MSASRPPRRCLGSPRQRRCAASPSRPPPTPRPPPPRPPLDRAEERQAEAVARAAEAASLTVPPVPRWLADDATPEALAGLLASYGRIALLSPEGDVFDQMAGRYNQASGPNLGVYLKGHAGDLLKVDRRGRPPEYVQRPC